MLAGLVALFGCARKAPGPEECARFADLVVQMSGAVTLTPQVREQLEEQTRQCLTKPYDRELIGCVERTQQARGCIASFRQRTRPDP